MKRSCNKLYQFVAAACLPISLTAQAQLEEVIVTAQKRAENLQDVPISISTVSGEKIQDNTILNFSALADFVPSLHIAEASVNTNIYMRGIGSGNNRGFEQSVGMYLDGVYLGRGRQYRSALLDVERVEVLRGPQGTLFGKNTVAGAINITSASPVVGEGASGEINVSIEENGGSITEGFIQGGGETFAARVAIRGRETDGYVYNAFLDQDEGATDEFGGRVTLVWEPSDTFSANLKYTYMERDRDGMRGLHRWNRSAFADTAYNTWMSSSGSQVPYKVAMIGLPRPPDMSALGNWAQINEPVSIHVLMTSRLCSMITTVLPPSLSLCSTSSSWRISSKWRPPVVGSSRNVECVTRCRAWRVHATA